MRRAARTAALVRASAMMSAPETYHKIEIVPERRTGSVQFDAFLWEPRELWREEACHAG